MKSQSTQAAISFVLMNGFMAMLASTNAHEGWRTLGRDDAQREYNAAGIDVHRTRLNLGRPPSWSFRKNYGIYRNFRKYVRNQPVLDRDFSPQFIPENDISTFMDLATDVKANPSMNSENASSMGVLIDSKINPSRILENATSLGLLSEYKTNSSKILDLDLYKDSKKNSSKFLENETSLDFLIDSETNPSKFMENGTSLNLLINPKTYSSNLPENATSLNLLINPKTYSSNLPENGTSLNLLINPKTYSSNLPENGTSLNLLINPKTYSSNLPENGTSLNLLINPKTYSSNLPENGTSLNLLINPKTYSSNLPENGTSLNLLINPKTYSSNLPENATSLNLLINPKTYSSNLPETATSLNLLRNSKTNPTTMSNPAISPSLYLPGDSNASSGKIPENPISTSTDLLRDSMTNLNTILELTDTKNKIKSSVKNYVPIQRNGGTGAKWQGPRVSKISSTDPFFGSKGLSLNRLYEMANQSISRSPQLSFDRPNRHAIQSHNKANLENFEVNITPTTTPLSDPPFLAKSKTILLQFETGSQKTPMTASRVVRDVTDDRSVTMLRPVEETPDQPETQTMKSHREPAPVKLDLYISSASPNLSDLSSSVEQKPVKDIFPGSEIESEKTHLIASQETGLNYLDKIVNRSPAISNPLQVGFEASQKQTKQSDTTSDLTSDTVSIGVYTTSTKKSENILNQSEKESQTTQIMSDQTGRDLDGYKVDIDRPFKGSNHHQKQTVESHNTQPPVSIGVNISSRTIGPSDRSLLQSKNTLNRSEKESQMTSIMSAQTGRELDRLAVDIDQPFKGSNQPQMQTIQSHTTQNPVNVDVNIGSPNIGSSDQPLIYPKVNKLGSIPLELEPGFQKTLIMPNKKGTDLGRLQITAHRSVTSFIPPQVTTGQRSKYAIKSRDELSIDRDNSSAAELTADVGISLQQNRATIIPFQSEKGAENNPVISKEAESSRLHVIIDRSIIDVLPAQARSRKPRNVTTKSHNKSTPVGSDTNTSSRKPRSSGPASTPKQELSQTSPPQSETKPQQTLQSDQSITTLISPQVRSDQTQKVAVLSHNSTPTRFDADISSTKPRSSSPPSTLKQKQSKTSPPQSETKPQQTLQSDQSITTLISPQVRSDQTQKVAVLSHNSTPTRFDADISSTKPCSSSPPSTLKQKQSKTSPPQSETKPQQTLQSDQSITTLISPQVRSDQTQKVAVLSHNSTPTRFDADISSTKPCSSSPPSTLKQKQSKTSPPQSETKPQQTLQSDQSITTLISPQVRSDQTQKVAVLSHNSTPTRFDADISSTKPRSSSSPSTSKQKQSKTSPLQSETKPQQTLQSDQSITTLISPQVRSDQTQKVAVLSHNSTPTRFDADMSSRKPRSSSPPSTSKTSPPQSETKPQQTLQSDQSITTLISPQVRFDQTQKVAVLSHNSTPTRFGVDISSTKPRSSSPPSTSKTSPPQSETKPQQTLQSDQSITVRSSLTPKMVIHSDNLTPVSSESNTNSIKPRWTGAPSTPKQRQLETSPPLSEIEPQQTLQYDGSISTLISPSDQTQKMVVLSHDSTPTIFDVNTSSTKPRSSGPPSTSKQNRSETISPQSITDSRQTLRTPTQTGSDWHGSVKRLFTSESPFNGSSNQTRKTTEDLNGILNRAQLSVNTAPTKLEDGKETKTVDSTQIESINPPDSLTSNKTVKRACHGCRYGKQNSLTIKIRGPANRRRNQIIRIQILNKKNPKVKGRKQNVLPIAPKTEKERMNKDTTFSNPGSRNRQTILIKNAISPKKSVTIREKVAIATTIQNGDISLPVRVYPAIATTIQNDDVSLPVSVYPAIERSSSGLIRTNVQPTQSQSGIIQTSIDKSQILRSLKDRLSQTNSFNKKSTESFLTEQMVREDVPDSRKGQTFLEKKTDDSIPSVSNMLCTHIPQQRQISDQLNLRKSTSSDRYVIPNKTNPDGRVSNKENPLSSGNERNPKTVSNATADSGRFHGFNISMKKVYEENKCRPEVTLNFKHGFRDIFGNNPGFGSENVGLKNGCAIFNGKSKIKLWRLKDAVIGQNFIIQLRFKPNPSAHRLNLNKEHLLSNCGWKVVPSIEIFITPYNGFIYFTVKTTHSRLTLKGKYHANSWNEMEFSYNGKQLRKTVNGIVSSHYLSGDVIPKSASVMIGFCRLENGFHGCIDYVKIFLCKSDAKFRHRNGKIPDRKNLLEE